MVAAVKRINFDVTAEQEQELGYVRDSLGASSVKDTLLRAIHLLGVLSREVTAGSQLYVRTAQGRMERLMVTDLESATPRWMWLANRPHEWRRQPWIKGRRLLASTIWRDMLANEMTEQEAADNWDLPIEAIEEAVAWSEQNQALVASEALEERLWLHARGVNVEPAPADR